MKLDISLDLEWPSYEDDISACIKQAILDEMSKEARKQAKGLRVKVAAELKKNEKALVERAMTALGKRD